MSSTDCSAWEASSFSASIFSRSLDPWAHYSVADLAVPFHTTYAPFWTGCSILAAALLVLLVGTSLMQARLGRVFWRGIHYLSFLTFALGVLHGLGSGTDGARIWAKGWYALTTAIVVGLCVNRVILGIQARRHDRVTAARRIVPRAHALRVLTTPTARPPQGR